MDSCRFSSKSFSGNLVAEEEEEEAAAEEEAGEEAATAEELRYPGTKLHEILINLDDTVKSLNKVDPPFFLN